MTHFAHADIGETKTKQQQMLHNNQFFKAVIKETVAVLHTQQLTSKGNIKDSSRVGL